MSNKSRHKGLQITIFYAIIKSHVDSQVIYYLFILPTPLRVSRLCPIRAHFPSPRRHIWRHETAGTTFAALHFLGTPQKSSKALKWDFEIRLHVNAAGLLPFAFSQIPGFYPSEDASLVEHPPCFATLPTSLKVSQ